jgi:hypothetical protein
LNTYQVALTSGATSSVAAENYNADAVLGLTFVDQFGNTVATFKPGTYAGVALVNPTAPGSVPANAYQPVVTSSSPGVVCTENDGTYNDQNL